MTAVDGDTAAEGVHRLVLAMYDALSSGDIGWFADHCERTADAVHVGVADSFWIRGDSLVERLGPAFEEVTMAMTPGDVVVGVWGDTAVAVDRPVAGFDDGSSLVCRATIVFARDGAGEWRLVHTHMSMGEE